MKGQLQDMAVADIIQHNCQDRKTARVLLKSGNKKAELFFKNGNVVHAIDGSHEGEEVVYQVMNWETGSFDLKTEVEAPAFTITRNWTSLLLEGAKRQDELGNQTEVDGYISTLLTNPDANGITTKSPHLVTRINEASGADKANGKEQTNGSVQNLMVDLSKQTDGFITAALATMKGDNFYTQSNWDIDVSPIIDQVSQFVKMVHVAVSKLDQGSLEDNLLTTDEAYILVRFLENSPYFLVIAVEKKNANLGNLRMLSRSYSEWLSKSLERELEAA
jgi:predicted regulator of Ras-like GTPase activity (Roadblock/LC7/MglB family)